MLYIGLLIVFVLLSFFGLKAEKLSEFYEVCKNVHIGRRENFLKIEQVISSLMVSLSYF